jgi:hypothetical protein
MASEKPHPTQDDVLLQALEALEPFERASQIEPIMVGRGENTKRRTPADDEAYDHRRAITWGMVRRARAAASAVREALKGAGS